MTSHDSDPTINDNAKVQRQGYTEETLADSSKNFICNKCNRITHEEYSMQLHIDIEHKSLKRTSEIQETSQSQTAKNPLLYTDLSQSLSSLRAFATDLFKNPGDNTLLNFSVVNKGDAAAFNSTIDVTVQSLQPDQDHNFIFEEEIAILKTKIISLNTELKKLMRWIY